MDFRILGELEVVGPHGPVELTAAKPRAVLAALLLRANEVVSADALVDGVWGERPPASAAKLVQVYVSQLRRALGDGRIVTRASGYVLTLEPEELDLARFERLLAAGRAALADGNARRARRLLGEALELWRGPALADVAYEELARTEAERLEQLRLAALEERIEADLALGRHEELVPELTARVEREPLRERLWRQLMLALYRSGRQAEALECFGEARRALDELGLEPATELRELQTAILRQDPGLAAPTPVERPPTNLPAALAPLLGRAPEVEELAALLRRDDVRLLTLVGAGGTGKTTLSLEVARTVLPDFAGGVFLVELAALRDAALVPAAIAAALAVEPAPAERPEDAVIRALAGRELLLVVDNAEHLPGTGPLLVELLRASPGLKALVTSRSVLHLSGERVYPVAPLDPAPAAALFVARAEAADPRFEPDAALVDRICERLDRLPLAIELAARRVRTLPLDVLSERLDRRLPLLTGGPRDLPARQQTLAATLAWSTDLLGQDERRTLARLSVFVGGCTLEAAEAVCGATLSELEALVDASLLQRSPAPAAVRLTMLETVREHADALLEPADRAAVETAHASYYAALAEGTTLQGLSSAGAFDVIDLELDNLRIACDRAESAGDDETALRAATALYYYWYLKGHVREGRERIRGPLDRGAGDARLRAYALRALAGLTWVAGAADEAEALALRGIEAGSAADALEPVMACHTVLGLVARDRGDLAGAVVHIGRSALLAEQLGLAESAIAANTNLADLALQSGDFDEADRLFERTLALNREHGIDAPRDSFALLGLGAVAYRRGRLAEAAERFSRALALADEGGFRQQAASALAGLAAVAAGRGEHEEAAGLLGRSSELIAATGGRLEGADAELYARATASTAAALGPERLAELSEEGRAGARRSVS